MSYETEEKAREAGMKVKNQIESKFGGKWELVVIQNLGFRWRLRLGTMQLYDRPHEFGNYHALIGDRVHSYTGVTWFHVEWDKDPVWAVVNLVYAIDVWFDKIKLWKQSNLELLVGKEPDIDVTSIFK